MMLNLIKMECYKLRRQQNFKIVLLATAATAAFSAYSELRIMGESGGLSGKASFANAFQDIFVLFFVAVFAGFYIGGDFLNRTIQSQISVGHSRLDIILSKALVFFGGSSLIFLLYPVTISLVHTVYYGWGEAFTVRSAFYVLRVSLLGILLNIGTSGIFVLLAFLCRDIPKTICLCGAFPVVFSLLSSTLSGMIPAARGLVNLTTLAQLKNIAADPMSVSTALSVILSAGITTVIFIYLSNALFEKAEIK